MTEMNHNIFGGKLNKTSKKKFKTINCIPIVENRKYLDKVKIKKVVKIKNNENLGSSVVLSHVNKRSHFCHNKKLLISEIKLENHIILSKKKKKCLFMNDLVIIFIERNKKKLKMSELKMFMCDKNR